MTESITESGLKFGPFGKDCFFHIEKSETYRHVKDGVPIVEFLLLRPRKNGPPVVWVVEAKKSTPKPETQPNFVAFIDEIRQKFTNTLSLGVASCLHRHAKTYGELPAKFKTLDLSVADFRLVLVINGHKRAWLPPLQEALSKALRSTVKIWALSANAVVVLNEVGARQHGLVDAG